VIRGSTHIPHPIVAAVRAFVEAEVEPAAPALEHADAYPHALVARMRELGLFGALVPHAYGGLGLDVTTYARVIEEICRGFMSLAGVLNSHTMAALIVLHHGTDEQRARLLPRFARGQARGGLCLTEPHAGSDVQALRTVARRDGDRYLISGSKMFVTNGREGNTFALLALTNPAASPRHRGMSCFIVEKGEPGLEVVKSIAKLGYKGVDTAELLFDAFPCPAANLVGGVEGRGFKHVMSGLETGRINIAARAVGVAQSAFEHATRAAASAGHEEAPALLGDIAARVEAARLVTYWAAGMKDRSERCDLEAGIAKLYASEAAQEAAAGAMRIAGPASQRAELGFERLYRDTPLMIIGEGTNEIQRLIITRSLLDRYGERLGALTSRESEPEERRQVVLAVRQLVDKDVMPSAQDDERAGHYPAALMGRVADLGILGCLTSPGLGGLDLDLATYAMVLEELARGSSTVAGIVAAQATATHIIERFGERVGERVGDRFELGTARQRSLAAMTRGERRGAVALGPGISARADGDGWALAGAAALVDHAAQSDVLVVLARMPDGEPGGFLVERNAPHLIVGATPATLGARGLGAADVTLDGVRVDGSARLGVGAARAAEVLARLALAATAVGLAQAAFEAALRYSQQRSTFGQPICQHQAVQLKLADMATRITAARLLTYRAAERLTVDPDDDTGVRMAKVEASEMAADVTLESMRIHGGYGYTNEFPVERLYRDAARLVVTPADNDAERRLVARRAIERASTGSPS
jgi:alkylation response protein AidB-like acyl-CoA dehydrogenase